MGLKEAFAALDQNGDLNIDPSEFDDDLKSRATQAHLNWGVPSYLLHINALINY